MDRMQAIERAENTEAEAARKIERILAKARTASVNIDLKDRKLGIG